MLTSSELSTLNFSGIVNLGALLLLVHNLRLVIENLYKHGWLFGSWFLSGALVTSFDDLLCVGVMFASLLPCALMMLSERLCAANRLAESANSRFHQLAIAAILVAPPTLILATKPWPHFAAAAMTLSFVLGMKMFSYHLVNRDIRRIQAQSHGKVVEHVEGVDAPVTYPDNLSLHNLGYFLLAPTLCYQLNYPRTPAIRWPFVARRTAQMLFLTALAAFITEQYLAPAVRGSEEPLRALAFGRLAERVLKLSVPNLYVWLLFFLIFFHYYLNLLAELLRFGDRKFYGDWWNSASLGYYWREWNLPVHTWLLRHVYTPVRRKGLGRTQAGLATFLLSAVAHEAVVSIPCHMLSFYAFFGMMAQLPLILLTQRFKQGSVYGNVLFWAIFCIIGQPLTVLLYYWTFQVWSTIDVRQSLRVEVDELVNKFAAARGSVSL